MERSGLSLRAVGSSTFLQDCDGLGPEVVQSHAPRHFAQVLGAPLPGRGHRGRDGLRALLGRAQLAVLPGAAAEPGRGGLREGPEAPPRPTRESLLHVSTSRGILDALQDFGVRICYLLKV